MADKNDPLKNPAFKKALELAAQKVEALTDIERYGAEHLPDNVLSMGEAERGLALQDAMRLYKGEDFNNPAIERAVYKKRDELVNNDQIVKGYRDKYDQLAKDFPDKTPGTGGININEVAAKEIAALKKDHPDAMARLEATLQNSNSAKPQSAVTTLEILKRKAEITK